MYNQALYDFKDLIVPYLPTAAIRSHVTRIFKCVEWEELIVDDLSSRRHNLWQIVA